MLWFTADTHYYHSNIILYENRPFKDTNHMHDVVIKRHNEYVKEDDTVFVIGDFAFCSPTKIKEIASKLNGNLIFIEGNHDRNNSNISRISSAVLDYGGMNIKLLHDPSEITNYDVKIYDLFLVGHVHSQWYMDWVYTADRVSIPESHSSLPIKSYKKLMINVGVDVWNYYPINLKTIQKCLKNANS